MKTILLVGDSSTFIRNYILENGMEYVQLRDALKCKNPLKRLKRRVVCDFTSEETIALAIKEVKTRYKIDGVICNYENYVLQTAIIANELELPGMPIKAAEACTDKYLMRQLFASAPIKISPDFAEVESLGDLLEFAKAHQFPLILKPANLAKSLLVTKNCNEAELSENYQKMIKTIDGIYKKYAPNRKPKIIIEEFMEGPIHSVDAFIDNVGTPHVLEQVVDYQTGYDIGYDDNFHYSRLLPSSLSEEEITSIRNTAAIGCKALGMKNSPAHVEIIRTKEGPMIVEIGARNGGYRDRMHLLANGIDIMYNALAVVLAEPIKLRATKSEPCAVIELFPKTPGQFKVIQNQRKLEELKSLSYFVVKHSLGETIGKSSDGYKMTAIIILHNADEQQFNSDLEFVNKFVEVITS